jgi:hypothetical protein
MTTTGFLGLYRNLILLSESSAPQGLDTVLHRFVVKTLSLNKHMKTTSLSQHEFLSIEVYDTQTHESHLVFLERTSSPEPAADSDAPHPYHNFFQQFLQTLSLLPSSPGPQDEEGGIPLLETQESQLHDTLPTLPTPSFRDAASLASAQLCRSLESLTGENCAGDQVVIGQHRSQTYGRARVIRQLTPDKLSFFQLITLADTVHDHDPLYTLFKRQCYWYANTIYCVIEQSYTVRERVLVEDPGSDLDSDLRIPPHIPPHLYLPPSAGRWKGLLVMVVSEDVVRQVKRKFECQFAELVGQIQEHWDKQASLRARISELENELGHANSRT